MATINLDLTNPINAIRAMVGDIDTCNPLMSDMMYQQIYDKANKSNRNECIVLWYAAIQAAEILMAHFAPTALRSRERVNAVEIEEYGSERYNNYKDLLKWLRNTPPLDCALSTTLFQFGGTYTECDTIYTLKYMRQCFCMFWPRVWTDGYMLSSDGTGDIYLPW